MDIEILLQQNMLKIIQLRRRSKLFIILALKAKRRSEFHRRMWLLNSSKSKRRSVWSKVENSTFWDLEVPTFTDEKFKNCFRVDRETFDYLVKNLKNLEKKNTTWRFAIPLRKRISAGLYALGSSAEYRTVASLFGIGRTTLGKIVLELCQEIWDGFAHKVFNVYPPNQQTVERIVEGFEKLGFPQCFGAIDGCHIEINPPKSEAVDYYNFKGWHSIVLFAAVDYRYQFTYISIGTPGRSNDSTIFENSKLKNQHKNNPIFKKNCRRIENVDVPVLLIGDSAFKLSEYVMKPYPYSSTQLPDERNFNEKLSKCRRVVENAFGHLKARFRKIGKGLEVNIDNVSIIVKACCVLHNICNERNDHINKTWIQEMQKDTKRIQPQRNLSFQSTNETGIKIRKAITTYLYTPDVDAADVDAADVDAADVDATDVDAADVDAADVDDVDVDAADVDDVDVDAADVGAPDVDAAGNDFFCDGDGSGVEHVISLDIEVLSI